MRLITIGMVCLTILAAAQFGAEPAAAQLAGHGGPVRALAVSVHDGTALSGSFDASAIRWSLRRGVAEQVLRFHEGAVNAVAILPDGRDVTAGEDGRIALWTPGKQEPDAVLEGHKGPIVALSVSPDGRRLASASWDGTIRLWPLGGGAPLVLESQQQNVNGVAFAPDGQRLVSAGYDGSLRIWPLREQSSPAVVTLPTPLNAVAVASEGEIITAGADGKLYFLSLAGEQRGSVDLSATPIASIALSIDGARIAASSMAGMIFVVDRKSRMLLHRMVVSRLPVWAVAFLPDGRTLLSGGSDRLIRRWNTDTGASIGATAVGGPEDPLAAYAGDPGAQVFRACVACHTLKPDEGSRAGPTLHGIFGRRIATLPGYRFSPALKRLDIVWTPETLAKLFEVGPARYTPGTKMPEQRITQAEDREALVKFLERAAQ
jgi:cytochrome c